MQTTFKLFIACLCSLALTLLSGCNQFEEIIGDINSPKEVAPKPGTGSAPQPITIPPPSPILTPAEQEIADKHLAEFGVKDTIVHYILTSKNTDEDSILRYFKYFVSKGADVNAKSARSSYPMFSGDTPLFWAIGQKHVKISEYLVSQGADVNAKNASNMTPLFAAVAVGQRNRDLELVKFLVSNGADVNIKATGVSPLHLAVGTAFSPEVSGNSMPEASGNLDLVKYLVAQGADINAKTAPAPWNRDRGGAQGQGQGQRYTPLDYALAGPMGEVHRDRLTPQQRAIADYLFEQGGRRGVNLP